jgi:hypothetical protein
VGIAYKTQTTAGLDDGSAAGAVPLAVADIFWEIGLVRRSRGLESRWQVM